MPYKNPLQIVWRNMISRCTKPTARRYDCYGGRGIAVCERWRESFDAFAQDVGRRPSPRHTIDRIDNDGNYEPENVRWATMKQQNNNRRTNHRLTVGGVTKTISEWAATVGILPSTLQFRISAGVNGKRLLESGNLNANLPAAERREAARQIMIVSGRLRMVTIDGVTKCVPDWADESGVQRQTIEARLAAGIIGRDLLSRARLAPRGVEPESGYPYVSRVNPRIPGTKLERRWRARLKRGSVLLKVRGLFATPKEAYEALLAEAARQGVDLTVMVKPGSGA